MSTPATSRLREVLAVGMYESEAPLPPPLAMAQEHLWPVISLLFAKTNLMKELIDRGELGPYPGYNSYDDPRELQWAQDAWDKDRADRTKIREKITNIDNELKRWLVVPEEYR